MDKFPLFYPLYLHVLNKITTFAAILKGNIFNAQSKKTLSQVERIL